MKKLVRKSMFVLSFMGLFTFGAPMEIMAQNDCPTYHVCCGCNLDGDGEEDCGYIQACTPEQLQQFVQLFCMVSVKKVDK